MKNMKKITALVLTFAIMLSSITFVNAAGISEETKKLNQLGLLLNITEEEVSQNLNRVIGITMVLKSLGYKDADVAGKAASNPFVDMDKFSWAKGFTAVAAENNITKGMGNNKFAPTKELSKKELLTFMLRVLGYNADIAWKNTQTLSKEAGILTDGSEVDNNFTKDDAARIMFRAMGAKLVNSDQMLVERLIAKGKVNKQDAIKVGLIKEDNSGELKVVSVSADNLRQITVVFNHNLDSESVKKLSNYSLKGAKGVSSRSINGVTLKEDNRTVLLTVGTQPLQQVSNYILTIKNVKDINGQVISKTEQEFTAQDKDPLKVVGIEFTGPKNVKVIFAEPVKSVGTVKVLQEGKHNVSTRTPIIDSANENVVNVETYSNFKEGVSYTFEVSDMKDYANYVNIIFTTEKTYEKESSAPTAEVVAADQGKVEVVFDRPVKGLTKKHFYHTFAHQIAKEIYKNSALNQTVSSSEYVSKVWVVFATTIGNGNYPLPKNTDFTILAKIDGKQIQDNWGNLFQTWTKTIDVDTDNTAPQIEDIDVQSDSRIVITFSKDLSSAGRYKLKKTNGSTITSPTASFSGKKVTITFTKASNIKSALLEIKGVKDNSIAHNEMAEVTRSVEFTDKVFAGPKSADFKAGSGQIFVNFDEEVASTAVEGKNYELNINGDKNLLTNQDITFGDNNRTVVITLDSTLKTKVENNLSAAKLILSQNITDVMGNTFSGFSQEVNITGLATANYLKADLAYDNTDNRSKLVLHFNREISEILDTNKFSITSQPNHKYNGTNVTTEDMTIDNIDISSNDRSQVVVFFTGSTYDGAGLQLTVAANALKDSYGMNVPNFTASSFTDKTKPKIQTKDSKRVGQASKSGSKYYIEVPYTEDINVSSLASGTYQINGNDKLMISDRPTVSNNMVKIEVKTKDGSTVTQDPITLTQVQSVSDSSGNKMEIDSEVIEVENITNW